MQRYLPALGLEVREDATALRAMLAQTSHHATEFAALAERAVSRTLGGSCSMPLAAHARWAGERLFIEAALGDANDARRPLLRTRAEAVVADAAAANALGVAAARQLVAAGAAGYLAASAAEATGSAGED